MQLVAPGLATGFGQPGVGWTTAISDAGAMGDAALGAAMALLDGFRLLGAAAGIVAAHRDWLQIEVEHALGAGAEQRQGAV